MGEKHVIKISYVDDQQFLDDFQLAFTDLLVADYDKNMGHSIMKFAQVFKALALIFPELYAKKVVCLLRDVINKDVNGLFKTSVSVLNTLKQMDGKEFEIEIGIREVSNEQGIGNGVSGDTRKATG